MPCDNTPYWIRIIIVFCLAIGQSVCVFAQTDSTAIQLKEVNIFDAAEMQVSTTPAALQTLSGITLRALPTLQLSDALKYLSGIVIKDYGGVGGMKTLSVRGLGTQHTGVAYDGLPLTDCQTGQIDLGKLSTENVTGIQLITGPNEPVFAPARLFSYSNLLMIDTRKVQYDKPLSLKTTLTVGSYGLIAPTVFCENVIKSKKRKFHYVGWNLSAHYLQSDGDYPYTLHYGGSTDSTSRERRQNSDLSVFNAEANVWIQLGTKQNLTFKAYYYDSQRGLQAATIFYNLNSAERLWNRNTFGQWHYHNYFSPKWAYQLNGKLNYDYTHYLNPNYLNENDRLDNKYRQYEAYLSNAVVYKPFGDSVFKSRPRMQIALSQDVVFNRLNANSINTLCPERWTTLTSLAVVFEQKDFSANGNVLLTTVNNAAINGVAGKDYVHLSPTIGMRYIIGKEWQIRAFYKNIFRMPTFNDLYYREVGNLNLNPEKTHQWNVGVTYNPHFRISKVDLSVTADGFFNMVKDKIIAFPNRNLFAWTMLNYGKVYIAGAEVNLRLQYRFYKGCVYHLSGNFTYQKAVDRTNPLDKTYNQQIPYTPFFSGSVSTGVRTPWIDCSYSVIWCGKRYSLGQNIAVNEMPGYIDHSLTLGHDFVIKKTTLGIKLELLNLSNKQYEIIRNYPMQGRSFRAKIEFSY